jgi:hypothetical protein
LGLQKPTSRSIFAAVKEKAALLGDESFGKVRLSLMPWDELRNR